MQGNGFSQFMKGGITPAEANYLTGGLAQLPISAEESARIVALKAKANAWKMFTFVKDLLPPNTKIPKGPRIMPMPNIPDSDKENLNELNKKRLMSLEAGNARHNQ